MESQLLLKTHQRLLSPQLRLLTRLLSHIVPKLRQQSLKADPKGPVGDAENRLLASGIALPLGLPKLPLKNPNPLPSRHL